MQECANVENARMENANKEKAGNGNCQHENEGMKITEMKIRLLET